MSELYLIHLQQTIRKLNNDYNHLHFKINQLDKRIDILNNKFNYDLPNNVQQLLSNDVFVKNIFDNAKQNSLLELDNTFKNKTKNLALSLNDENNMKILKSFVNDNIEINNDKFNQDIKELQYTTTIMFCGLLMTFIITCCK